MARRAAATALLMLALAWVGAASGAESPADRMLVAVNEARDQHGLEPLAAEASLARAAQAHARDMSRNGFVGHRGSDGAGLEGRLARVGYDYRLAAENVAAGHETPGATVAGWMDSDGHRRNILSPGLREAGVGYAATPGADVAGYRHYWVLVLGARGQP